MKTIPKKTKYRLSFRNKIQTRKIQTRNIKWCTHILSKTGCLADNYKSLNTRGWIPSWSTDSLCKLNHSQAKEPSLLKQSYRSRTALFGAYGIITLKHGTFSAKWLQTVHLTISKILKKKARAWVRICCQTPVTARPAETRMGKGKGAISHWEVKVRPGQILFEFGGMDSSKANFILKNLQKKSAYDLALIGSSSALSLMDRT